MPVGEQRAFLQLSNSAKPSAFDTAGITVTFSTSAQVDPEVRVQNMGTSTLWIGIGSRSTSSAAVTTQGICLPPANNVGCIQILRSGGYATLAAFPVGATQTALMLCTGGEGLL